MNMLECSSSLHNDFQLTLLKIENTGKDYTRDVTSILQLFKSTPILILTQPPTSLPLRSAPSAVRTKTTLNLVLDFGPIFNVRLEFSTVSSTFEYLAEKDAA